MYRCLCVSIICIVLIIIFLLLELGKYIDEDGNPILTSQQLRSMYVEGIVDQIFPNIYNGVIDSSIKGKTSAYFTIMCIKSPDPNSNGKYNYGDDNPYNCDNYDGYQQWWIRKFKRTGGEHIPKNIQTKLIRNRVINKLQSTFPDSNITKSYTNCCYQYRIDW